MKIETVILYLVLLEVSLWSVPCSSLHACQCKWTVLNDFVAMASRSRRDARRYQALCLSHTAQQALYAHDKEQSRTESAKRRRTITLLQSRPWQASLHPLYRNVRGVIIGLRSPVTSTTQPKCIKSVVRNAFSLWFLSFRRTASREC
jgi:hypothetical protein